MLTGMMRDVRQALRSLLSRPLFALVAVATLALGIGANTAIYSLAQQWLLQPLPVSAPEQLVNLSWARERAGWTSSNTAGSGDAVFSYPTFRDLEQRQDGFGRIAAHRSIDVNLALDGDTASASGLLISGSYFGVLGVQPALGRLLDERDDAAPGVAESVVLGYGYWQNRLGGRAEVIGRTLRVNGVPLTIVGVAPPGFTGTTLGARPEVFVPITLTWSRDPDTLPEHESRKAYWVYLFARMAPGLSIEQAQERINGPFHALVEEVEAPLQSLSGAELEQFRASRLTLSPGARGQSLAPEQARLGLGLLFGVTALVLLIACVNLANLMLARGAARGAEMAVRAAIGASRGRLLRQLLAESGLIALAGALTALPVALAVLKLLGALFAERFGSVDTAGLAPNAVIFAFAAAAATALLFGLYPALELARTAPIAAIRGQGPTGAGRASTRLRGQLAVAQIALSMALLVVAGLFSRSLSNLADVDLGLRTEGVLVFTVAPPRNGYDADRSRQVLTRIEDALAGAPGVTSASQSRVRLLSDDELGGNVSVEGFEVAPGVDTHVLRNEVSPGFFATLGIPLLAGRDFTAGDDAAAAKVAVVNRRFAERFGLGEAPVGKRVSLGTRAPDVMIVGLVETAAYAGVKDEATPQLFMPVAQRPVARASHFYVRTSLAPESMMRTVEQAVARVDPNLPVEAVQTLQAQRIESIAEDRLLGHLSAAFALLATVLAATGLYGLLAYTIAQRTRELGLRQALGAAPQRLRAMVLGQVARMGLLGCAIGLIVALGAGHVAQSLLFGMSANDPAVYLAATALMAVVVLAAAGVPAWRASRVAPMEALRHD